jgi:hypothetical protein
MIAAMVGAVRIAVVALVVAAVVGHTATTAAQADGAASGSAAPAPVKDPAAARKFVAAAQQLVARGNALVKTKPDDAKAAYENAQTALQRAIEVGDDINVYFQLGQVDEKLAALPAAYAAYKVLAAAPTGAQPALVKQAKARLDDLAGKLGLVTLVVTPDGVVVSVDHSPVGTTPLKDPVVLMPGSYTVSFAAVPGYEAKDLQLQVDPGSETERKIELAPAPAAVVQATVHEPATGSAVTATGGKPPSKLPLYIGAGAFATFGVTTIVTGLVALHDHSIFVARETSPQDRYDAQVNGRHQAIASDVFLVGTVAAAGFTAGWYYFKYRKAFEKKPVEDTGPKLDLGPWVEPTGGGLLARGTF